MRCGHSRKRHEPSSRRYADRRNEVRRMLRARFAVDAVISVPPDFGWLANWMQMAEIDAVVDGGEPLA
jgi:hypothetical protein